MFFSWNFSSSLKFLECQVLLPVGLSLKVTVLFAFARSLKRIATCKLSRHVETRLRDLKTAFCSKVLPIVLANFCRIPIFISKFAYPVYSSNRLPVRSR